jgi:hypothetical protein
MVGAAYDSLGYDGFHDWPLLQDRYMLAVLFEYAATLGLIGIEYVSPVGAREDYRDNWGGDDLDQLSRYLECRKCGPRRKWLRPWTCRCTRGGESSGRRSELA